MVIIKLTDWNGLAGILPKLREAKLVTKNQTRMTWLIAVCPTTRRVVGCGGLREMPNKTGRLRTLWVDPAYRGQGIGGELFKARLKMARDRGYRKLTAYASPMSLGTYLRHGFTVKSEIDRGSRVTRYVVKDLTAT